jgi:hypothetical protein
MIKSIFNVLGSMNSLLTLAAEKLAEAMRKRLGKAAEARQQNDERADRDRAHHLDLRCEPEDNGAACDSKEKDGKRWN